MVVLHSVFIINRAGGLIYSQTIRPSANPAASSLNDQLRLASTFHGLSTIASELVVFGDHGSGKRKSGIHTLQTERATLKAMKTITGVTFVVVGASDNPQMMKFLQRLYQIYTDYALKNPFYEMDMPIKCQLFDQYLRRYIAEITDQFQ